MDINYKRKLVAEAKHSFVSVWGLVGPNTDFNLTLLKWPDVIDCLLNDNDELFLKDIGFLVCNPLKILVESLQDMLSMNMSNDVKLFMDMAGRSPIEAKKGLIELCNLLIVRLRLSGKVTNTGSLKNLEML